MRRATRPRVEPHRLAVLALERDPSEIQISVEDHFYRWAGGYLQLVFDRAGTAYYRGAAPLDRAASRVLARMRCL